MASTVRSACNAALALSGRNLKSTGQNSSGGLTSATAGYMGPAFAGSFGAVQPGQNPYAAYAGKRLLVAFLPSIHLTHNTVSQKLLALFAENPLYRISLAHIVDRSVRNACGTCYQ